MVKAMSQTNSSKFVVNSNVAITLIDVNTKEQFRFRFVTVYCELTLTDKESEKLFHFRIWLHQDEAPCIWSALGFDSKRRF